MRTFSPQETEQWLATLDRRVASAVAWLETPDGKLIVVHSDYKSYWALPGGIVDPDESPLDAVCREVKEEIGIILDARDVSFCYVAHRESTTIGLNYQFIFRAKVSDDQIASIRLQEQEIEAVDIVAREQIKNDGRVYAPSVIAWREAVSGYIEIRGDN